MPKTNSPHWFLPAHVAPCHIQAQTGADPGLCPQGSSLTFHLCSHQGCGVHSWRLLVSSKATLAGIYPRCQFDQGPGNLE